MVEIDASSIRDEASFHRAFKDAFRFPDFYGNNLNAWIDCMSYLDNPTAGMSSVHVERGQTLCVLVSNASGFKLRCPELFLAMHECAAFVNWHCVQAGDRPLIALAMHD